jgi:hypothetical protein
MSNKPSTYTKDMIRVMEWGLLWRMKQEVPHVASIEGMKPHLKLKTADVCKLTKTLKFWKGAGCRLMTEQ